MQQSELEDFYEAFPQGMTELKKAPILKYNKQVEEADITAWSKMIFQDNERW